MGGVNNKQKLKRHKHILRPARFAFQSWSFETLASKSSQYVQFGFMTSLQGCRFVVERTTVGALMRHKWVATGMGNGEQKGSPLFTDKVVRRSSDFGSWAANLNIAKLYPFDTCLRAHILRLASLRFAL